jgi:hypothetical protein
MRPSGTAELIHANRAGEPPSPWTNTMLFSLEFQMQKEFLGYLLYDRNFGACEYHQFVQTSDAI